MSLSLARKKRNRENSNPNGSQADVPTKKRHLDSSQLNASQQIEDTRRCGKLLNMRLTNFMCHSNLYIDFHSRVNFLVGSNGSGKSAVLAALVLGLGGNAKTTNRSRSVKGFIKTGESAAKIEITIANDGPQPYEPEVYGDKITVVRTITLTSGSYTIKDASGHIVTKKIDDLHRILMYHNVQVDNPVFVLNQDSAREFLKDLEPGKNYSLFLKATQVDVVMEKLNDCLHLHRAHINELKNYKTKLEKEREDIAEHKQKLEELLSFEKLKDVLKQTEIEHAWLLVSQCENIREEYDVKLERCDKKVRELQHLIQNKEEAQLLLTQKNKTQENTIALKNDEYEKANAEYRKIKQKVDEKNKKAADVMTSQDLLKKKKSRLEKQIEDIKKFIEQRSGGNQDDVDILRAQNEKAIADYRIQCKDHVEPMIENLKRDLKLHMDSKAEKDQVVNEIKRRKKDSDDEIRLKNAQIANVRASIKNKLLIYGEHMPRLTEAIKTAHSNGKFSKLPRGPLGSHVEVPNCEYRNAVENFLGVGLLGAFLVNSTKDRQVLEQILSKLNCRRPMIITNKFSDTVYNINNGCVVPPQGTRLLMQEIVCKDSVVMNCLIDRAQIECMLLTHDKNLAESITSVRSNVPRNLNKVIVLKEGNIALEYYPMPRYRMYSSKIRPANFIQVNIEERIKHLENEKLTLINNLKGYEKDLSHIAQQIPQDIKFINEKRELLTKQGNARREILEKITELENVEYADYSNEIELLKNEMQETEERLNETQQKLDATRQQLTDVNNEKVDIEEEASSHQRILQDIQKEIEALKAQADQIQLKLRSVNNNDATNRSKLNDVQEITNKFKKERKEIDTKLKKYMDEAMKKGERLETDLSINQIEEKMSKINGKLKHGKPITLDWQSMTELITTKEEALEISQGNFDNIKSSIDSLRKSLKFRFDFLKKLKEHMALILQLSFGMILKLRKFEGTLDVNHHDRTLKISVIPRDHNKNAVSSTKSLSGGERSYSTVAFLISLWSCVDHPFYFLDEYDVFTDEVNREYMTRLLVDEGRKRPLRQYSFLTPQDMSLMSEDFINILRLGEPDRG